MMIISKSRWKEVFVDLTDSGSLDHGTRLEPYNDVASIPWQNNIKVRFKRGETHRVIQTPKDAIDVPVSVTRGILLTDYGDADDMPVFSGAQEFTSGWVDEGGGVYSRASVTGNSGCVFVSVDGGNVYMPLDQKYSQASMTAGSYYIAKPGGTTMYIWMPGGENPNNHLVEIAWTRRGFNLSRTTATDFTDDVNVRGVHFRGWSQNPGDWQNTRNAVYRDNYIDYCGGNHQGGVYLGSGPQIGPGCSDILLTGNTITQVQDSGITPQTYSGHPNPIIRRVYIQGNSVSLGAYGGIEVANWNAAGIIEDVYIEDNDIFKMGYGFAGDAGRTNHCDGIKVIGDTGGTNTTGTIVVRNNRIADCANNGISRRTTPGATLLAERNRISGSPIGIRHQVDFGATGYIQARFNEVSQCPIGIWSQTRGTGGSNVISKNTVVDADTYGIQLAVISGNNPEVNDNCLANGGVGIQSVSSTVSPNNNNVHGFTTAYAGFTNNGSNTTDAPEFVDEVGMDYRPSVSSALVGAGSGQTAGNDVDGSPYTTDDVGCHRGSGIQELGNILDHPRDFSAWADVDNCAIATNEEPGPAGRHQADVMWEDDLTSNIHRVRGFPTLTADTVYRCSVRVRAVDVTRRSWLRLELRTFGDNYYGSYFDLDTAALGSQNGVEGDGDDRGMVDLGGGWYECWMDVGSEAGGGTPFFQIKIAESNGDTNFQGNGQPSFYLDYAKVYESPGLSSMLGHWIALNSADDATDQDDVGSIDGVKVVQITKSWSWFEDWTSSASTFVWNQANLDELRARVGQALADGYRVQVRPEYKSWTYEEHPAPFWVGVAGYEVEWEPSHYAIKMYEPVVVNAFKRLLTKLAEEFSGHYGFGGITLQEPSLSFSEGYSKSEWVDARCDILQHACDLFPNGLVVSNCNFHSGIADISITEALQSEVAQMSGYDNYVFGSTDILPGQRNIINDNRQKGVARTLHETYPDMLLLDSFQNHDFYYEGDGVGAGGGSQVAGYPPFGGGTYHDPNLTIQWIKEQVPVSIIMTNNRKTGAGNTITDVIPIIEGQPDWVVSDNVIVDPDDYRTGNWGKSNLTVDAGLYIGVDSHDDTNTTCLLREAATNSTHILDQDVPAANVVENVDYVLVFHFASASELSEITGGHNRRIRAEFDALDGTTYAANFHWDIPNAVSSDGAPECDMYELYEGFWYCWMHIPMGSGNPTGQLRFKIRNGSSNNYLGDDTAEALGLKYVQLKRRVRP